MIDDNGKITRIHWTQEESKQMAVAMLELGASETSPWPMMHEFANRAQRIVIKDKDRRRSLRGPSDIKRVIAHMIKIKEERKPAPTAPIVAYHKPEPEPTSATVKQDLTVEPAPAPAPEPVVSAPVEGDLEALFAAVARSIAAKMVPVLIQEFKREVRCLVDNELEGLAAVMEELRKGSAVGAIAPVPQDVADAIVEDSANAVKMGDKDYADMDESFKQLKDKFTPAYQKPAPRVARPRIVVAGLLNGQATKIAEEFGNNLDLRFITANDGQGVRNKIRNATSVIGMIGFMNHSMENHLKEHTNYRRIPGGMDALRKHLSEIVGAK